jgi:hypothetical protein
VIIWATVSFAHYDLDDHIAAISDHNHSEPEVEKHRMYELKHESENVKALLLLDNSPAHPSTHLLRSTDGKIKCLFLPPNTSSLIQPTDHDMLIPFYNLPENIFSSISIIWSFTNFSKSSLPINLDIS